MFYLETEFFSWNFLVWAVNFLLAALAIIAVALVLKGRSKLSFAKGEECGEEEPEQFVPAFEKYLRTFRGYVVDVWQGYSWLLAASPLFFLALFLIAVCVR